MDNKTTEGHFDFKEYKKLKLKLDARINNEKYDFLSPLINQYFDGTMDDTRYLGDGVYAEFDGYGVWLRANIFNNVPGDSIYLEPSVLEALNDFFRQFLNIEDE